MRSLMVITAFITCSMTSSVSANSRLSRPRISTISPASATVSPAMTSSRSSSSGLVASARASSSRRRSENSRSFASASLRWSRCTRARIRSARRRASARLAPRVWSRPNSTAAATLSCTEISPKGRVSWNVRAMPRRQISCGRSPVMSSSLNRTRPAVGLSPQITLNSVVFPAPFGPMTPSTSPRSTERSIRSRAWTPPKLLLIPRVSSRRPTTASSIARLPVARHPPDPLDLDGALVACREWSDAVRRAGRDEIARRERHHVRGVLDQLRDVPDHGARIPVLAAHAVHPELERQIVWIGHLVGGHQQRADRREAVEGLPGGAVLVAADRDVHHTGVAEDVSHRVGRADVAGGRADDGAQLDLVVGPTIRKRQFDRVAGADNRRGRLEEHAVLLDCVDLSRHDRAHLLDVQAVVRRRRDGLGGGTDGRAEADASEWDARAG